ncbi:hypothetical protein LC048_18205 [Mesobacillus subterraneus]|uniref:hypothetical protein n=1 Tax=Mesobacillus subterraneus TaxID=285983 RepID=UPI00273D5841|nr:hypothetical protein [Mesobacillus subterraneus]WLR54355.1 hypothetical protein LC048_18205 [Mesobacillus subterraneus]
MNITHETHVLLHSLNISKDTSHYIVEDVANAEFYEMPEACIVAIESINNGIPLGEIEKSLIIKYPKEDIDLVDFVDQLLKLGLVSEIDGEVIPRNPATKLHSGFTWIPQILGSFFFNSISSKLYFLLLLASVGLILIKPDLFPRYSDLFVFDLMFQNVLALIVISFFLVILHEFGHVLAVRSEGLPAKIEVGNRLFFCRVGDGYVTGLETAC